MTVDIGFNPTPSQLMKPNDAFMPQTITDDYGFFDGVLNPNVINKTVIGGDTVNNYYGSTKSQLSKSLSLAGGALQMYGQTQTGLAQIDNIMANVGRTERNIEQIELEMMDMLDVQVRKVSKRHGTQMARVGASGVGFSGSPLLVMAESHARGMQDYDAIEQRGRFAIDSAYQGIYDSLDQAKDIAGGIMIGAVTTLAGSVYGYNKASG